MPFPSTSNRQSSSMRLTSQTAAPFSSRRGFAFFLRFFGGFEVPVWEFEDVGRELTEGVLPAEGGTTGGSTVVIGGRTTDTDAARVPFWRLAHVCDVDGWGAGAGVMLCVGLN